MSIIIKFKLKHNGFLLYEMPKHNFTVHIGLIMPSFTMLQINGEMEKCFDLEHLCTRTHTHNHIHLLSYTYTHKDIWTATHTDTHTQKKQVKCWCVEYSSRATGRRSDGGVRGGCSD